jgi:epsilon-lactone hydrolase
VTEGRLNRLKARLRERRDAAIGLSIGQRRLASAPASGAETFLPGVDVDLIPVNGVACERVRRTGAREAGPLWVHLHGGAFCLGEVATFRRFAATLALATGWRVIVPEYRLAPEAPFPAGYQDCKAVLEGLIDSGEDVVLSGDSAGGWFALRTVMALRDKRVALPLCLVLMSPWLDLRVPEVDEGATGADDPVLTREDLRALATLHDPHCLAPALLAGDLTDLPPTLVQTGTDDLLAGDSRRLAHLAKNCTLSLWPDMFHGFQFFAPGLPEAEAAVRAIASFGASHAT